MNLIRPDGMAIRDWCDYTGDNLARYVPVLKIDRDEQWPSWGEHAANVLKRRGVIVPNPSTMPDFVEWASRFNQAIANLE